MIIHEQVTFIAQGDRFTPSLVAADFTDAHDPGVVGKRGRYRGVPVPYGVARVDAPKGEKEKIAYLHRKLVPLLSELRVAGAEVFDLRITYQYQDQCALGFSKEEMKMIAELDCVLAIDCWEEESTNQSQMLVVEKMDDTLEFPRLVSAVLARYLVQNGRAAPAAAEREAVGVRLWALVAERGLPRPLAAGECGTPGGMGEEECAPLVARVMGGAQDELLATVVKQLVKACFYPEFTVCRDSYREPTKDGGCKRQELERVSGRVSGAHCVDCPHWVALTQEQNEALLAREWRVGGPEQFAAHREVFVPEDFRALRQWLHARARNGLS